MGLETGSTIAELDAANPTPSDKVSQGDDHLTLIKRVLKLQFPGENGQGFDKPITATEDELNFSEGLTGNIQDQLALISGGTVNNLFAPVGTRMVFHNVAPPSGWSIYDAGVRLMRIVPTSGGLSGGEDNPVVFTDNHTHATSDHALTKSEMPLHDHLMFSEHAANNAPVLAGHVPVGKSWDSGSTGQNYTLRRGPGNTENIAHGATGIEGSGVAHSHGNTTASSSEWRPMFTNVIIGTKT